MSEIKGKYEGQSHLFGLQQQATALFAFELEMRLGEVERDLFRAIVSTEITLILERMEYLRPGHDLRVAQDVAEGKERLIQAIAGYLTQERVMGAKERARRLEAERVALMGN